MYIKNNPKLVKLHLINFLTLKSHFQHYLLSHIGLLNRTTPRVLNPGVILKAPAAQKAGVFKLDL